MSKIVIQQEREDLEGLLADLYRRIAHEGRGEATAIAALLREFAAHFERLGQNVSGDNYGPR